MVNASPTGQSTRTTFRLNAIGRVESVRLECFEVVVALKMTSMFECVRKCSETYHRLFFISLFFIFLPRCFNPFTPKSDQCQLSPAASAEMLHHTVWRTWLFIVYSDERWLCYQLLATSLIHWVTIVSLIVHVKSLLRVLAISWSFHCCCSCCFCLCRWYRSCSKDDTLQFHSESSSHRQRFSLEAFKFIADHPFVFIHCHVKICNATDHACARKCSSRDRRAADHVRQDGRPLYSLSEGPFLLKSEETGVETSNSRASGGKLTIHQRLKLRLDGIVPNSAQIVNISLHLQYDISQGQNIPGRHFV